MTSRELAELEAYERIDPQGAYRDDMRIGKAIWRLATISPGSYSKEDFMMDFDPDPPKPKQQTMEEARAVINAFMGKPRGK